MTDYIPNPNKDLDLKTTEEILEYANQFKNQVTKVKSQENSQFNQTVFSNTTLNSSQIEEMGYYSSLLTCEDNCGKCVTTVINSNNKAYKCVLTDQMNFINVIIIVSSIIGIILIGILIYLKVKCIRKVVDKRDNHGALKSEKYKHNYRYGYYEKNQITGLETYKINIANQSNLMLAKTNVVTDNKNNVVLKDTQDYFRNNFLLNINDRFNITSTSTRKNENSVTNLLRKKQKERMKKMEKTEIIHKNNEKLKKISSKQLPTDTKSMQRVGGLLGLFGWNKSNLNTLNVNTSELETENTSANSQLKHTHVSKFVHKI